jgi:hypothetical protein
MVGSSYRVSSISHDHDDLSASCGGIILRQHRALARLSYVIALFHVKHPAASPVSRETTWQGGCIVFARFSLIGPISQNEERHLENGFK